MDFDVVPIIFDGVAMNAKVAKKLLKLKNESKKKKHQFMLLR